jgi:hypothetical protein
MGEEPWDAWFWEGAEAVRGAETRCREGEGTPELLEFAFEEEEEEEDEAKRRERGSRSEAETRVRVPKNRENAKDMVMIRGMDYCGKHETMCEKSKKRNEKIRKYEQHKTERK